MLSVCLVPDITSFKADPTSSTNVTLTWSIRPNGILTSLDVSVYVDGANDSVRSLERVAVGQHVWGELKAYTEYQFVLHASTSKGGNQTRRISATTREACE